MMCFGELPQWFLLGGELSFDMLLGPKAVWPWGRGVEAGGGARRQGGGTSADERTGNNSTRPAIGKAEEGGSLG